MYGEIMFEEGSQNPSCGKCEQCSCDKKAKHIDVKPVPSVNYKFLDKQDDL